MKTLQRNFQMAIKVGLALAIVLVCYKAQSQTFYLTDYTLGNRFDRNNATFSYKTPYYYDWSIRKARVDSLGGEIELHVNRKSDPDCYKAYRISWVFSKDVSTVSCGEDIFIDITNQPIYMGDCNWDWVSHNPSSLSLITGPSGLSFPEVSKDPTFSYWEYVFHHLPALIIQGEPQFTDQQNFHLHHARLKLDVCSRSDMAKDASGGAFYFHLEGRGIEFDIEYRYAKGKGTVKPHSGFIHTGPVSYIGVHEHSGCDNKQSFCKKYLNHPVKFDSFYTDGRKLTGTIGHSGNRFEGTFNGDVFNFTYNAGSSGRGTFYFSPDFKTFTGTFEDDAGHRGIWSGDRN